MLLTSITSRQAWNAIFALNSSDPTFSPLIFLTATRETAFIHAISAAAITHEITHQCTLGRIPGCGCSSVQAQQRSESGDWIINGCGENIEFGEKEARRFIDTSQKGSRDARTAVNLHSFRVGREVRYTLSKNVFGISLVTPQEFFIYDRGSRSRLVVITAGSSGWLKRSL